MVCDFCTEENECLACKFKKVPTQLDREQHKKQIEDDNDSLLTWNNALIFMKTLLGNVYDPGVDNFFDFDDCTCRECTRPTKTEKND